MELIKASLTTWELSLFFFFLPWIQFVPALWMPAGHSACFADSFGAGKEAYLSFVYLTFFWYSNQFYEVYHGQAQAATRGACEWQKKRHNSAICQYRIKSGPFRGRFFQAFPYCLPGNGPRYSGVWAFFTVFLFSDTDSGIIYIKFLMVTDKGDHE